MPKFTVHGSVGAGKYMGEYEADTPEQAADMAYEAEGGISLCHQCSSQAEDAQVISVSVCNEAGEQVFTDEAP